MIKNKKLQDFADRSLETLNNNEILSELNKKEQPNKKSFMKWFFTIVPCLILIISITLIVLFF